MDIRHLGVGVSVYLPCQVAGCGLTVGDPHYAQGDGEVSGTAIEMSADITVTTELIKGTPHWPRPPLRGRCLPAGYPPRAFTQSPTCH